jgi:hypothetical protein
MYANLVARDVPGCGKHLDNQKREAHGIAEYFI